MFRNHTAFNVLIIQDQLQRFLYESINRWSQPGRKWNGEKSWKGRRSVHEIDSVWEKRDRSRCGRSMPEVGITHGRLVNTSVALKQARRSIAKREPIE